MDRLRPTQGMQLTPALQDSELLSGRKKVTLAPGHSLMDWIRLGRTKGDLSGVGGEKRAVTLEELALHNTTKDMWMAIRGQVYNLTPYLEYHPGGVDELMRAAGGDGTQLFDEIHNWVNVESMLSKCLVGSLIGPDSRKVKPQDRGRQTSIVSVTSLKPPCSPPSLAAWRQNPNTTTQTDTLRLIPPTTDKDRLVPVGTNDDNDDDDDDDDDDDPLVTPGLGVPRLTWQQTTTDVVVEVNTALKELREDCVIVDLSTAGELLVQLLIQGYAFFVHTKLPHPVKNESIIVEASGGKARVTLSKENDVKWTSLGAGLKLHQTFLRKKNAECQYRLWTCCSNTEVTHDTRLLAFTAPPGLRMTTPPGLHIFTKKTFSGMEIARSYTVAVPSLAVPTTEKEVLEGRKLYLMIKKYPGGVISPWITAVQPGDKIHLSDFAGSFDITRLETITHLVCFAAGTGFTSMLSVIKYALFNLSNKKFPITLVFYNKTKKDILWNDQLDELAKSDRFSVTHVLSQESPSHWPGLQGRVSADHVKKFVPQPCPTSKPLLLVSGPWAYNDSVDSLARIHGLEDEHLHIFSQST